MKMDTAFICPSCHSALTADESSYSCPACGERYWEILGVPLLVKNLKISRQDKVDDKAIADLASFLNSETGLDLTDKLRDAFAMKFNFEDTALQIESAQFINRMRASGKQIGSSFPDAAVECQAQQGVPINRNIEVSLSLLVAPAATPVSTRFGVQVRIKNQGKSTLSSFDRKPFYLTYFWDGPAQGLLAGFKDGAKVDGLRTSLLIDLPPGAAIGMPVQIESPRMPGEYQLRLVPAHEGVGWLEEAAVSVKMLVADGIADPFEPRWKVDDVLRDYDEDHRVGIDFLKNGIKDISPSQPKILELGGNASPMILWLPGTKFNVDVDIFGLFFGSLRRPYGGVTSVAADGMNLPFADGYLDAIVLFATFHHFADPIGLLKHLKTKLAPGGIIFLLCEPVGHVYRDTAPRDFIEELKRGVNEQSFALWEYDEMFRRAGLDLARIHVDAGSLKAALRDVNRAS